jgi:hypothetical protein
MYNYLVYPGDADEDHFNYISNLVSSACDDFFDVYSSYPQYVWNPSVWSTIGINQLLPLYQSDFEFHFFLGENDRNTTDTDDLI